VRSDGMIELRRAAGNGKIRRWGGCTPDEWAEFVKAIKEGKFDELDALL
jgi:hypothetical protein